MNDNQPIIIDVEAEVVKKTNLTPSQILALFSKEDTKTMTSIATGLELDEEEEALQQLKKTRLSKTKIDSIQIAQNFIAARDALTAIKRNTKNELNEKIDNYLEQFEDLNSLEENLEEYKMGDGFNDHYYKEDIKEALRGRIRDVTEFTEFIINIITGEEE